jgi:Flp pilus assembly pilin Flp
MSCVIRLHNWLTSRNEAQDLLEYALLVALIAVGAVAAIAAADWSVQNAFNTIANAIAGTAS